MSDVAVKPWWCTPWPTVAQSHLLQAILGDDALAAGEYRAWRAATDLAAPVDFATYRLMPSLYLRLNKLGIADDFSGRCRGTYRRAWAENTLLFGEVSKVLERLNAAGIPTLLLKGAALALVYYPEQAARPMSDIDVAVRIEDADRAMAVIAATPGWRRSSTSKPDVERLYKHATGFERGSMQLDLHWYCLMETRQVAANDWLWRDAVSFELHGIKTLRPRPSALLLSVIVHGMRCNPASPVRWIADAVQILRQDSGRIDWDELLAFAARQRLSSRLGLGLDYVRRHFGCAIPPDVVARLLGRRRGMVERMENSLYLADPAAYDDSFRQRLWRVAANYVAVTGARSGAGLAVRMPLAALRFPRFREDLLRYYAAVRASKSRAADTREVPS